MVQIPNNVVWSERLSDKGTIESHLRPFIDGVEDRLFCLREESISTDVLIDIMEEMDYIETLAKKKPASLLSSKVKTELGKLAKEAENQGDEELGDRLTQLRDQIQRLN